jgi:hypothetical protein
MNGRQFDDIAFYLTDPRFRRIWENYEEYPPLGSLRVFVLRADDPQRSARFPAAASLPELRRHLVEAHGAINGGLIDRWLGFNEGARRNFRIVDNDRVAPTKTLEPIFVKPQLVLDGEKNVLSPTRESWLRTEPGQNTFPAPTTQKASIELPAMTIFAGPSSAAELTKARG